MKSTRGGYANISTCEGFCEKWKPKYNVEINRHELKIPSLKNLYEYNIGLTSWCFEYIFKNSDKYEYRTRQGDYLEVPTFTTELGIRSFKIQAVRIWNNVFKFLRVDIKIKTFKKH